MKRGTPNHPKVYNLMALLKISRPAAIGYLELLFHFAAEYAPDGHLGRYSVARIEAAMDWRGGANRLVAAMWGVGFVDMDTTLGLCLHDYEEHADGVVHKRLSRAGKCFVKVTEKVTVNTESLTSGIQSVTEEFKSLTMNCVPRARGPIQSNPYTPPTPSTHVEGELDPIPVEGRDGLFAVEDTREQKPVEREKRKRFVRPTLDEVRSYCAQKNSLVDPEKFWNHYESNGWRVGKNPMANWHSAIATWERSAVDRKPTPSHPPAPVTPYLPEWE